MSRAASRVLLNQSGNTSSSNAPVLHRGTSFPDQMPHDTETASPASTSLAIEAERKKWEEEKEAYEARIQALERKIKWLKRTSIEYWLHATYRWFKYLPDRTQLRFIKLNEEQMGSLRQYPGRPIRYDELPAPRDCSDLPTFGIATPSYNQAPFIEQTVRSVMEQEGLEIDYLVQDGASTDGTIEKLRDLESGLGNFRWVSEKDDGQADAINRGLGSVTGDILAWINSDDFYAPGALGCVAAYFRDHPEVDVVYGHRICVDAAGQEIGRWVMPPAAPDALSYFDYIPQETVFWRRSIWEKVGGVNADFQFAMDWDLLRRFRDAGAIMVRLPYYLACFRVHPEQKTSAKIKDIGKQETLLLRPEKGLDPAFDKRFRKVWFREHRRARISWLLLQRGKRSERY